MTILKFSLTAIILASLSWQVAAFDPDKALEGHDLKKIGLEGQELRDAGVVKKGTSSGCGAVWGKPGAELPARARPPNTYGTMPKFCRA